MRTPDQVPPGLFNHGGELVDGQIVTDRELGEGRVYLLDPVAPGDGRVRAFVWGDMERMADDELGPLVRMHSACLYGDALGMQTCDCGPQLHAARQAIKEEGQGILFDLMDHEGRGAGLIAKAAGYAITAQLGLDTFEAFDYMGIPRDQRTYASCARFLRKHDITALRLLTNNPDKMVGLEAHDIAVYWRPLRAGINSSNKAYLAAKQKRTGHLFEHMLDD